MQIYFGAHGTAEDIRGGGENNAQRSSPDRFKRTGLAELYKNADVYVPELHGWTDLALSHLQQLSYGRVTPEQLLAEMSAGFRAKIQDPVQKKNFKPERDYPMYGFRKGEMEMIYQSYKPVVILDVPRENPKSETLQEHELGESRERPHSTDTFEKTLATIKRHLRTSADLHNEREDFMLSQITPKLEEVFKERPDLKKKPNLQVLMFLGASHTRVAHMLSKYGVKVESHHSRLPQKLVTKTPYQNEKIKRDFYEYLRGSKGFSESSIRTIAGSISQWETFSSNEDFINFNKSRAVAFRGWLP